VTSYCCLWTHFKEEGKGEERRLMEIFYSYIPSCECIYRKKRKRKKECDSYIIILRIRGEKEHWNPIFILFSNRSRMGRKKRGERT